MEPQMLTEKFPKADPDQENQERQDEPRGEQQNQPEQAREKQPRPKEIQDQKEHQIQETHQPKETTKQAEPQSKEDQKQLKNKQAYQRRHQRTILRQQHPPTLRRKLWNRTKYTLFIIGALCTCGILIPAGAPIEMCDSLNEVDRNGFIKGLFREKSEQRYNEEEQEDAQRRTERLLERQRRERERRDGPPRFGRRVGNRVKYVGLWVVGNCTCGMALGAASLEDCVCVRDVSENGFWRGFVRGQQGHQAEQQQEQKQEQEDPEEERQAKERPIQFEPEPQQRPEYTKQQPEEQSENQQKGLPGEGQQVIRKQQRQQYRPRFPRRILNRTKYTLLITGSLCTCGLIPGGYPLEESSSVEEVHQNGFCKGFFRVKRLPQRPKTQQQQREEQRKQETAERVRAQQEAAERLRVRQEATERQDRAPSFKKRVAHRVKYVVLDVPMMACCGVDFDGAPNGIGDSVADVDENGFWKGFVRGKKRSFVVRER